MNSSSPARFNDGWYLEIFGLDGTIKYRYVIGFDSSGNIHGALLINDPIRLFEMGNMHKPPKNCIVMPLIFMLFYSKCIQSYLLRCFTAVSSISRDGAYWFLDKKCSYIRSAIISYSRHIYAPFLTHCSRDFSSTHDSCARLLLDAAGLSLSDREDLFCEGFRAPRDRPRVNRS